MKNNVDFYWTPWNWRCIHFYLTTFFREELERVEDVFDEEMETISFRYSWFLKKLPSVHNHSMKTIYLSLRAQVSLVSYKRFPSVWLVYLIYRRIVYKEKTILHRKNLLYDTGCSWGNHFKEIHCTIFFKWKFSINIIYKASFLRNSQWYIICLRTKKVWYPIPSESESLEALVTTLDIPQFAAAESARGQGFKVSGLVILRS